MLTLREIATLRAALLFWQEEMCPHGKEAMLPYLEPLDVEPLSTDETARLREVLRSGLRYAIYNVQRERLDGTELFTELEEAELAAGELQVVAVLVPAG